MEYPAITEAQEKKVIAWIASGFESSSGFKRYGVRLDPDPKIRRYGEEFVRILSGSVGDDEIDLPQLRHDLLRLIDKQCPAIDCVELMLRCTSERSVALSCGLQRCDIAERDLAHLERCMREAKDAISQLRRSTIPGSLSLGCLVFVPDHFSGAVEAVEQAKHHLKTLSDCSASIAKQLSYRPADTFPGSSVVNPVLKNAYIGCFYAKLKVYQCGHPTLGRLLRAMRHVRYLVDGDSEFLRALDYKCEDRDGFTDTALQRRMNRFVDSAHGEPCLPGRPPDHGPSPVELVPAL